MRGELQTSRKTMPLSGEAIRLMNYIDDVAVTLRRVLATVPTLSAEERARVAEHLIQAKRRGCGPGIGYEVTRPLPNSGSHGCSGPKPPSLCGFSLKERPSCRMPEMPIEPESRSETVAIIGAGPLGRWLA